VQNDDFSQESGCLVLSITAGGILLALAVVGIIITAIIVNALSQSEAGQPRSSAVSLPEVIVTFREGLPDASQFQWELIASGFDSPVSFTESPDGTGRFFVIEQTGSIWIIEDGEQRAEPFLDVSSLLPAAVFRGGYSEQGLLGFAFAPDYATSGFFFISYTDANGDSVIARYEVSDSPLRANEDSTEIVLQVDQPFPDHNGGHIVFGPDGYLYIGLGDGGSQYDPMGNAQSLESLLGKILRIDVSELPYRIPADNPFADTATARGEIWSLGLRNPWRMTFDRATGDMYVGDVGTWTWEEVNFQPVNESGLNYGWNAYEALVAVTDNPPEFPPLVLDAALVTMPFAVYSHNEGCAVTGGYVYRGDALPELQGVYLYGDYCNGRIWAAYRNSMGEWQSELYMETNRQISSFGQDRDGELYLIDYKGEVLKLVSRQE
jgi:glucose/arabinose dehydrogenase